MHRLIDMPAEDLAKLKALRRNWVLLDLLERRGEEEIYRRWVGVAIEAARHEGYDEAEVEVAAAQARRDVADALVEFRTRRRPTADLEADIAAARAMAGEAKGAV